MATVKELIKLAESRLDDASKDVNVAKVLFYHLADKQPHELYLMYDEEVSSELEAKFLAGMEEYYQGKPIQYIKGVENFFGRDFKVNEDVLIPRYETEELVENILYRIDDYFAEYQSITLCDVGTGSGAIATSLALEEPRLKVFATDISLKAVTVAKDNAKNLGANIEFMVGDMLEPLLENEIKVDILFLIPHIFLKNKKSKQWLKIMNHMWLYLVVMMDYIFIVKYFRESSHYCRNGLY